MTDAPRLRLVDAALEEVAHDPKQEPVIRSVLTRFAPSIAKQARKEERQAIFATVGAKSIEDLTLMPKVRAAFEQEEHKHGRGMFWRGTAAGALVTLVTVSLVFVLIIRNMTSMAFDEAQQATQQGALVGAAAANQNPDRDAAPAYERQSPREPLDAP
jgi:hypothetical protein